MSISFALIFVLVYFYCMARTCEKQNKNIDDIIYANCCPMIPPAVKRFLCK